MIRITLPEKVSKAEKQSVIDDPSIRVGVEFEIESETNVINYGAELSPEEYGRRQDEFVEEYLYSRGFNNLEVLIQDPSFGYVGSNKKGKVIDQLEEKGYSAGDDYNLSEDVYVALDTDYYIDFYNFGHSPDYITRRPSLAYYIELVEGGYLGFIVDTFMGEVAEVEEKDYPDYIVSEGKMDDVLGFAYQTFENQIESQGAGDELGVVEELKSIVGDEIKVYDEYHAGASTSKWRIEPDSSLATDNGFELIAPKGGLPLDEILPIIKDVFALIEDYPELYTSDSSGFHVNISIEGVDLQKDLDRLKLALFMEEGKVFEYFKSRKNNQYTQSVLKALQKDGPRALRQASGDKKKEYREIINDLKNSVIPEGKYYGINFTKLNRNYVEFRYLGGKNYHTKYNRIRSQILDFAFFLKVATTPGFKRKEYLKKIARLLDDIEEVNKVTEVKDKLDVMGTEMEYWSPIYPIDHREQAEKFIDTVEKAKENGLISQEDVNNPTGALINRYLKSYMKAITAQYVSGLFEADEAVQKLNGFAEIVIDSRALDDFKRLWNKFIRIQEIPEHLKVDSEEILI